MWDSELREMRTAVFTFDSGERRAVQVTMPSKRYKWHEDTEKAVMKEWNAKWPNAAHKVVKVHLMRK